MLSASENYTITIPAYRRVESNYGDVRTGDLYHERATVGYLGGASKVGGTHYSVGRDVEKLARGGELTRQSTCTGLFFRKGCLKYFCNNFLNTRFVIIDFIDIVSCIYLIK